MVVLFDCFMYAIVDEFLEKVLLIERLYEKFILLFLSLTLFFIGCQAPKVKNYCW